MRPAGVNDSADGSTNDSADGSADSGTIDRSDCGAGQPGGGAPPALYETKNAKPDA